jgi:tetratricopeptide (TPR) repeat protein
MSLYLGRVGDQVRGICTLEQGLREGRVSLLRPRTSYTSLGIAPETVPGYDATDKMSTVYSGWYRCSPNNSISSPCVGTNDTALLTALSRQRVENSSALDMMLRSMYDSGMPLVPSGAWGFAFEEDGLWRGFPYYSLDGILNFTTPCERTGKEQVGYDPRCRPWYQGAITTSGVFFTSPYVFAQTPQSLPQVGLPPLGVTAALKSVSSDGTLVGVCMADFELKGAQDAAVAPFLTNGFSFLANADGNIILHPKVDWSQLDTVPSVMQTVFGSAASDDSAGVRQFRDTVIAGIQTGTPGLLVVSIPWVPAGETTQQDSPWFVVWRPVAGTTYTIVLMVPQLDVDAVTSSATAEAANAVTSITIGGSLIVVFFSAIASLAVFQTAVLISNPILLLRDLVKRVSARDFSGTIPGFQAITREMAHLASVFRELYVVIQRANESVKAGRPQAAVARLERALRVFARLGNERGQGMCHNNLGGAYLATGDVYEAIKHLRRSVEFAELATQTFFAHISKSLRERDETLVLGAVTLSGSLADGDPVSPSLLGGMTPSEVADAFGLAVQEARRQENLGRALLMLHGPEFVAEAAFVLERARRTIEWLATVPPPPEMEASHRPGDKSPSADEERRLLVTHGVLQSKVRVLSILCRAHAMGSILVRERMGRATSMLALKSAQDVHASLLHTVTELEAVAADLPASGDGRRFEPKEVIDMRVAIASAVLLRAQGRSAHALAILELAIRSSQSVVAAVCKDAYQTMAFILERDFGMTSSVSSLQRVPPPLRDVIIMLDNSGSMAGELTVAVRDGLKDVILTSMSPTDRVALFYFSSKVQRVFGLHERGHTKSEQLQGMLTALDRIPTPWGETACYDAVSRGIDMLEAEPRAGSPSGRTSVILCVTDGEDNASETSFEDLSRKASHFCSMSRTAVVFATLRHVSTHSSLEAIAAVSNGGAVIEVDRSLSGLPRVLDQLAQRESPAGVLFESY